MRAKGLEDVDGVTPLGLDLCLGRRAESRALVELSFQPLADLWGGVAMDEAGVVVDQVQVGVPVDVVKPRPLG